MKKLSTTYALIALFFAGLIALWWLDYMGVPTEEERRQRLNRILPELIDVPEGEIQRVEIDQGAERLVFERQGAGRWQMRKPTDVAADPNLLETLVRNLKDLRRSPDSGTIAGEPETFGLAKPAGIIRLWRDKESVPGSESNPLASLEIGKTLRDLRYVRAAGTKGIEVVDSKLFSALELPLSDWREKVLVPIPTFQVARLSINREKLALQAERGRTGRWRLTQPVAAAANGAKIESTLAALGALRVQDGSKGFAADDVSDFAPYGLDKPRISLELQTANSSEPLVLHVGKPVEGSTGRVYVRRDDQNDVVIVDSRFLSEIPDNATAYRSQQVAEIDPNAVTEIQIQALGATFKLDRKRNSWELESPRKERADNLLVQSLLSQVANLQSSEFLEPSKVVSPGLDPPLMTLKIWQADRTGSDSAPNSTQGNPALSLRIGRHDVLKKSLFSQLEGDNVVLAIPDTFRDVLPKSSHAYRDRAVLSLNPAGVEKLSVTRGGRTVELQPAQVGGQANQWRMRSPVEAPADLRAVTQILASLANLRAEDFLADSPGDGKAYGLDQPAVLVSWELERESAAANDSKTAASRHTLRIGKQVAAAPGTPPTYCASLDSQPFVFSLSAAAVQPFLAELHETLVMSFRPDDVRRLVLRWPDRTLAFSHAARPTGAPTDWIAETGTDPRGIDLSRFNDLVKQVSQLRTTAFLQYAGTIPAEAGLSPPRLTLEIVLNDGKPPRTLRIGATTAEGVVHAAEGTGTSGPVFFLPAVAWDALIKSGTTSDELPRDVFGSRHESAGKP